MKQAIIVGASSGLGYELAIQLAAKGYQLGLMARRESLLEELQAKLPGEHFIQVTDVTEAETSQQQLKDLIARMGDVELIVLSSGVGLYEKKLDWTLEREMIDVNVRGFAALSIVSMDHFMARGAGHLAGISSVAAHMSAHWCWLCSCCLPVLPVLLAILWPRQRRTLCPSPWNSAVNPPYY